MDHLLKAVQEMLDFALGTPPTDLDKRVILVLSLLVCVIIMRFMCRGLGAENARISTSIFASAMGLLLILAGFTAVKLFTPRALYREHHLWILPVASAALSLIVTVPLVSRIMKMGYLRALFSWTVSVLAVAAVILIIGSRFEEMKTTGRAALTIERRRGAYEAVLDDR